MLTSKQITNRTQPGVRVHPDVHCERRVLVAVPAAVHDGPVYRGQASGPRPLRLGVPAVWVQSINPVFIIVFAGVFAAMWTKLGPRQPSSPIKFAAGTGSWAWRSCLHPDRRRRCQQCPAARAGRSPSAVHVRGAVPLPRRTVARNQTGAGAFPHADGRVVLPVGRARDGWPGTLAGFYDRPNEVPYFLWIGGASIVVGLLMAAGSRWITKMMAGVR